MLVHAIAIAVHRLVARRRAARCSVCHGLGLALMLVIAMLLVVLVFPAAA
jgi:hypothetical protein